MTETVVEKIESRQNHSKAWRLSDKESGWPFAHKQL